LDRREAISANIGSYSAGWPAARPCNRARSSNGVIPRERRERLRKAFLFTPNESDPCEPLRNLLGDRWARGGWRRRWESLLQPLQPAEERLHEFRSSRYCRAAKQGRPPPASPALPVGRPPAPGMVNRGPSTRLPSGETNWTSKRSRSKRRKRDRPNSCVTV
jgi:hypothetical protein